MSGGDAVLYYASKGRLRRRLRASTSIASKYKASYNAAVAAAGGGAGTNLARTTSGIIFFDDFVRSDRALNGDNGWVDDAGTWSIVSNVATSSGGNFDRCRNTGMTATAAGMWEARAKAPSGGVYHMLRFMASSSTVDYHFDMKGDNSDKRFSVNAATDNPNIATGLGMTMDATSYHVIKCLYIPTRKGVVWFDHVVRLGTSPAVPFDWSGGSTGPTAAAAIGMMGYGGAPLFDWVLVSSGYQITVTGLTGTQAFRLFASGGATIGSSAAQTAGSATLDIATLVDGLTTGYIEVHPTTSFASMQARYPAVSGDATDIAGGDSYAFS